LPRWGILSILKKKNEKNVENVVLLLNSHYIVHELTPLTDFFDFYLIFCKYFR